MLDAFAERLRKEVAKPTESLGRYLARFVRPGDLDEAKRIVGDYVLGLPDNITLLNAFLMAKRTPLVVKMFYASVLAYLLNPKDFLPEESYGLYGYLDDAYLVASALQRTIGHIPRTLRDRYKAEAVRLDAQRDMTIKVREYLPPVVLEKLSAALDSFELAAFVICDQSKVGDVQSALGSRFSTLSDEE